MEVNDIVRTYRKKRGMTLKELSMKSGVSLTFICDIENNRRKPSPEKAKLLADALNIDVKLLLDEKLSEIIEEVEKDAGEISNPDIRAIARAGKQMNQEEAAELRQLAERLFPNAFKNI